MMLCKNRKCFYLKFLLSILLATVSAHLENVIDQPKVTIDQGILFGRTFTTRLNRTIAGFLGIPYAEPPVGNRRFANPVAAGSWNGILNATVNARPCAQIIRPGWPMDEDCLYLNVYTPQLNASKDSSLLPVMVFIHGGAFTFGSASSEQYSPGYLLDEDVLLVIMQYRLGPFGFFCTGDEIAAGNWGLKDQVLALKWVQENIEGFGGDPAQVTLFGESAGGGSVHLLTLSESTTGLFHRYIAQSGSALGKWAHRPRSTCANLASELGRYVGCQNDTSETLVSCLRTIDFADIAEIIPRFWKWDHYPDIIWGPTDEPDIEGAVLTDSPENIFAAGRIRNLPAITGVTRDEGLLITLALHLDEEKLDDLLSRFDYIMPILFSWTYQSDSGAAWVNAVKSYYFNNDFTTNKDELLDILTSLTSDGFFNYPAWNALNRQLAIAESPQYFYTFNYRGTHSVISEAFGSKEDFGVGHADDLMYIFGYSSELSSARNESMREADSKMVENMVALWTSFAITGVPTAPGLNGTTWEPYSSEDNYLRIGDGFDTALEMQNSFHAERMQFWTNLTSLADTYRDSSAVDYQI